MQKFTSAFKTAFSNSGTLKSKFTLNESGEIVTKNNIDTYIPKFETDDAKCELLNLQNIQREINATMGSWDTYKDRFEKNEKYLIKYARSHDVLKSSVDDLKQAQDEARDSVIRENEALSQQTLSAKASRLATKALSIGLNILASLIISTVISAITNLISAGKEIRQQIAELGDEFNTTKESILDYKEEIEDLQKTIHNQSSSLSEVSEARKQLLSIQNEMIEKYGTEVNSIKAITKAIKNEAGAWEELIDTKWQETRNQMIDNSQDGWWKGLARNVSNFFHGYDDNIDRMIDEYGEYEETIFTNYKNGSELKKILEAYGVYDENMGWVRLTGNATEVYNQILQIQQLVKESGIDFGKNLDSDLAEMANAAKKVSEQYEETWNEYILNDRILTKDSKYADSWKKITDEYNAYQTAVESGDEEIADNQKETLLRSIKEAMDAAAENGDTDVFDYLRDMYPELQAEISSWNFKANFELTTDDLKTDVEGALSKLDGYSKEDLADFNKQVATDEENEAYIQLERIANDYKFASFDDFLDQLESMDLVKSNAYDNLVELFGKKAVDALSQSDLEIAYTISAREASGAIYRAKKEYEQTKSDYEATGFSSDIENYEQATEEANEYIETLDDVYKAYNGINNMDRDIIYWDDKNLKKYAQFVEEQGGAEELKGTWSTVLGSSENIDGIEIAYTQMLQTDHGLVPLTSDNFQTYLNNIFKDCWNEDGTFDADKFIQLDAKGTDMLINGQMEHVANMIAAAEGQYMNGVQLTADDVIAIGTPGYDDNGKDLLPDNNSQFKGHSMHEVQQEALYPSYALAQTEEKAKETGQTIEDIWNKRNAVDEYAEYSQKALNACLEEKKKFEEEPLKFSVQMSGINDLATGLDQLDSVMADIIDGEDFDYTALFSDDFKEAFGGYEEEYENFIKTVTESPKDISKCQTAFNKLATAYINSKDALGDLTVETRESSIAYLEQMGVANAKEIVDERLALKSEQLAIEQEYVNATGKVLIEQTWEEISAQLSKAEASDFVIQKMALLKLEQMDLVNNPLDFDSDISSLLTLAKAAGVSAKYLEAFSDVYMMQQTLEKMETNGITDSAYKALKNRMQNALDKISSDTSWLDVELNFTPVEYGGGKNTLAAKQDAAKDATDDLVDALEKEKEALEKIRDEYDELYDAVCWYYDQQIDKIDDKIDALNDENEALEKQKDNLDDIISAIEDNYDTEIDKIQEKIDAIQDENDEEERALKLEEAKQKLQEAKSRKTKMIYQKGKGFVYEVDSSAIEEAEQELEDLQDEEVINQLEKQIELLEKAKERWSEIPDAYDKAMRELAAQEYFGDNWRDITLNASDELVGEFQNKYTGLQSAMKAIEDRIESYEKEKEALEDLKELWEDAKNAYEYAQYEMKLASFFGSDYEYQLLNNSAIWRQQYASKYSEICTQIEELEKRIEEANNQTTESTTSNAEATTKAYTDAATAAEESTTRIQSANENLGNTVSEITIGTSDVIDGVQERLSNIESTINTLNSYFDPLVNKITILYDTLQKLDDVKLNNLINQIGGSDGGSQSSEAGKSKGSGGNSLLSSINAVSDAIGSVSDDSNSGLLGLLNEVNNAPLDTIISTFGSSGETELNTESLLSAVNTVSNAIGGDDESSLLYQIKLLSTEPVIKPVTLITEKFSTLLGQINECVLKIEELSNKIANLDTSSLGVSFGGSSSGRSGGGIIKPSASAYSSGTGKYGLQTDKPGALVGEAGREIVVRNGRYFTVDSPTVMDLKKGDIVFNNKQTESIFRNKNNPLFQKLDNNTPYIKNTGNAFYDGTMKNKIFDALMNGLPNMSSLSIKMPDYNVKSLQYKGNVDKQPVSINIGDIHVHGVNNVDGLSREIINRLPNTLMQKLGAL